MKGKMYLKKLKFSRLYLHSMEENNYLKAISMLDTAYDKGIDIDDRYVESYIEAYSDEFREVLDDVDIDKLNQKTRNKLSDL